MTSENGLKPTSAADVRKIREEGVLIPLLYSGFIARIGPVNLERLIASGAIPDILTEKAAAALFEQDAIEKLIENRELFKTYVDLFDVIIPAAFIEPSMAMPGEEPGENQITVEDVHYLDKAMLFNSATAGARSLISFRDQQIAGLAAIQNIEGHSKPAQRPRRRK